MLQAVRLLNLALREHDRLLYAGPKCELARGIEVDDVQPVVDNVPENGHIKVMRGEHVIQTHILCDGQRYAPHRSSFRKETYHVYDL